jgi:Na+/melibiose symporter-like transporter
MLVTAGWLPSLAGYTDTTRSLSVDMLKSMWLSLIVIQTVCVGIALLILWYYPLTRAKSAETRRRLDERQREWEATPAAS